MRFIAVVFTIVIGSAAASGQGKNAEPLQDAAAARQVLYRSFTVEFRLTENVARGAESDRALVKSANIVPDKETVLESTNRITMAGDLVRIEFAHPMFFFPTGELVPQRMEAYYNGKVAKLFYPAGLKVDGVVSGIIEQAPRQEMSRHSLLLPLILYFRGLDTGISPYPLGRFHATGARLPIDGVVSNEYLLSIGKESSVSAWVVPSRDYVIRRMRKVKSGRLAEQIDIQYEQNSDGRWLPKEWIANRYSNQGAVTSSTTGTVLELRMLADIPNDRFDVTFPPECTVFDQRDGKHYRVKNDGSMRELTQTGEELSDTVYQPGTPWYRRNMWLLVAAGLVIAGLVLVVRVRKARAI